MQVEIPGYMARKKALVCKFIPGMEALKDWSSMALQFSVTAVGIMILQAYLNGFGSVVIAGYTAAGKVENLVTQPFTTLGSCHGSVLWTELWSRQAGQNS